MCYWVLGFAFGLSPLSLTRLYHGITVLSSPNLFCFRTLYQQLLQAGMNGIPEPSIMLGRWAVALERGSIIAGNTVFVNGITAWMLRVQHMDFCVPIRVPDGCVRARYGIIILLQYRRNRVGVKYFYFTLCCLCNIWYHFDIEHNKNATNLQIQSRLK